MSITVGGTNVTYSDSTNQATAYVGYNYTLYTSGTNTFTVPTGITKIKVTCIAGGGGATSTNAHTGGQGGLAIGYYSVTPGGTYTATVGAGGNGVSSGTAGSGGSSSLGSLISATGGGGGTNSSPGVNGVGSSGTFANTWMPNNGPSLSVSCAPFAGLGTRNSGSSTAATWTPTLGFIPGSGGYALYFCCGNVYYGGVGGAILIEY
jgi:hypothetical protein